MTIVDRRPMTEMEAALVRAAVSCPWNWQLRAALAGVLHQRGLTASRHDSVGDLVDTLELIARGAS